MLPRFRCRRSLLFVIGLALAGCSAKEPGAADAAALPDSGDLGADPAAPDPLGAAFVYDPDVVQRYDLELSDASWAALIADPAADEYVEGTFRFGDEIYAQVGVRFKGNSSRWSITREGSTRYSFKVKLNEFVDGQTFHGVKTLNLHNAWNDYSFMRERLSYDLFRDAGVPASRVAYVDLYVNGNHQGLYVSVEQVDKNFLATWFGDKSGNLYKPEGGDLTYHGASIDAYGGGLAYELKTNEDVADYSGLIHFLDVLNNTADADFKAAIEPVFDVELFLKWLALNTLLVSLDSYAGSIAHNFYLYDNPTTGRFALIPWDYNEAFGHFSCQLTIEQLLRFDIDSPYCKVSMGSGAPTARPLITRILAVSEFRDRYHALLEAYATGAYALEPMTAAIERWRALIADYVAADPTKRGTFAMFEATVTPGTNAQVSMPAFIEARVANVLAALDGTLAVTCGDGICDSGESCDADCSAQCPACSVHVQEAGRCLPSCADQCSCPTDLPVTLTCEATRLICVPQAPVCDCSPDQVCAPNGHCVPRCTVDTDCPSQVPVCEPTTGLCHP
ncbi:MAG: CotH kinase family protein [Deltaproteobacteria bacterium]|nr:CotH kinase family protein [Deltaproteobacteria bacterium]